MMLAPRSFSYSPRKEKDQQDKRSDPEKRPARSTTSKAGSSWRPAPFRSQQAIPEITARGDHARYQDHGHKVHEISGKQSKEDAVSIQSVGHMLLPVRDGGQTRSKPVAVPGKRRETKQRASSNGIGRAALGGARDMDKHDPSAMSPSVAALLAMTNIPRRPSHVRPRSPNSIPRRYSSQQLMDEWKHGDVGADSSIGTSPKMHVLLTPPNKISSLSRSSSEETIEGNSPDGSLYLESVPSLTADDRSTTSSSVNMSPRETFRRPNRQRQVSVSTSVQDEWEHPLSLKEDDLDFGMDGEPRSTPDSARSASTELESPRQAPKRRQTTFKSNLSSSLSALRSTWRSVSNFASTPYLLPEDHLSRGLFDESRVIQREMRPRPSEQPPSAELRRYLNPSAYRVSPHSDFHYHGDRIEHTDYEHAYTPLRMADMPNEGTIIALQDRFVEDMPSMAPSSSLCNNNQTEAGRAMQQQQQHDQQYRRELRENSEWLRICVLETNMRRVGKLDGPGHARIWLPARVVTHHAQTVSNDQTSSGKIPRRWVATYA